MSGDSVMCEAILRRNRTCARYLGHPGPHRSRAGLDKIGRSGNGRNDPGYHAMHKRLQMTLPMECARADESCKGRLEVALRRDTAPSRRFPGSDGPYSRDPADYERLCTSHHKRQDYLGSSWEAKRGA